MNFGNSTRVLLKKAKAQAQQLKEEKDIAEHSKQCIGELKVFYQSNFEKLAAKASFAEPRIVFEEKRASIFERMLYPDIMFIVDGKEFSAHKCILATRCKFFENMFGSGMQEAQEKKIRFDDISKEAFLLLLEFIYCVKLDLTVDSAFELLRVADKYAIAELVTTLEDFLIANLSTENYVKISNITTEIDNVRLKTGVLEFMANNNKDIMQRTDIFDVSKDILIELLKANCSKQVQADSEENK